MKKWTFPVVLCLPRDPANAGEAQAIAAKIESALLADRDLERDLAIDDPAYSDPIVLQPNLTRE